MLMRKGTLGSLSLQALVILATCAGVVFGDPASEAQLLRLAARKFGELGAQDEKLFRAVATSSPCDYTKDPGKTVLASNRIYWLCTNPEASQLVGHRGIEIHGARIEGEIRLADAEISFPLTFRSCTIAELVLRRTRLRQVSLTRTHAKIVEASRSRIRFDAVFGDLIAAGGVKLDGARIGGSLIVHGNLSQARGYGLSAREVEVGNRTTLMFLKGGTASLRGATIGGELIVGGSFAGSRDTVFDANGLQVGGAVRFLKGFAAAGSVILRDATIRGSLSFTACELEALDAGRINVEQAVILDEVVAKDGVNFAESDIGKSFRCASSNFRGGRYALDLFAADIDKTAQFRNFTAKGQVRLLSTRIGRDLVFSKSTITNEAGFALNGNKLAARAVLFRGSTFRGGVDITDAVVTSNVEFERRTKLFARDRHTLWAERAQIRGNVYLRNGFEADGSVELMGASVGGQIDCTGGMFRSETGPKLAFGAERLDVAGGLYVADIQAWGEVRLTGASIGGQLDCSGGTFRNPGKLAINASRLQVGSHLHMDRVKAFGEVRLEGATIEGSLHCSGGEFDAAEQALNAIRLHVFGSVFIDTKAAGTLRFQAASIESYFSFRGDALTTLDLRSARIGTLRFSKRGWPQRGRLLLHGLVYNDVADGASPNVHDAVEWLRHQPSDAFYPQPYEQLARVFTNAGHDRAAIEILIAKEEDRSRITQMRPIDQIWHGVLGVTIAYGYRPWQVSWLSFLFVLTGWGLFGLAFRRNRMSPAGEESASQTSNALVYSIDAFVPLVDFHQARRWLPEPGWRRGYLWVHTVAGWTLTTLLVAGLTGLVR